VESEIQNPLKIKEKKQQATDEADIYKKFEEEDNKDSK